MPQFLSNYKDVQKPQFNFGEIAKRNDVLEVWGHFFRSSMPAELVICCCYLAIDCYCIVRSYKIDDNLTKFKKLLEPM